LRVGELPSSSARSSKRNRTRLIPVFSFYSDTHHVVSRYSRPPEILRQSSTDPAKSGCAVGIAQARRQGRRLRKGPAQESHSTCRRAGARNRGARAEGPREV